MNKFFIAPFFALLLVVLGACTQGGYGQKQTLGTLIGAGLGGLAGSQIGSGTGQLAAVGVGVLLGALLGHEVGKSLDQADRMYANRAAHQAFEYGPAGVTRSWRNPDTGHYGTITPTHTYQLAATGQYCREYQTTVTVGGNTERAYGKACRQPDGSWQIH